MTSTFKRKHTLATLAGTLALAVAGTPVLAQSLDGMSASIDRLRASSFRHHPERGEVRLAEIKSFGAARPALPLDPHLSIFVSDVESTSQLKFSEVMEQLVRQGRHKGQTRLELFHQWWDVAAQSPGLGLGPHCDDESAPVGNAADFSALATRNGFPYRCPRFEQTEAQSDPFADESAPAGYSAIAFSNRFDLIGSDVADPQQPWRLITPDCGEYRIVFARNSGKTAAAVDSTSALRRNLIIFEARVPNPKPRDGRAGCRPILDFWHGLSDRSISAVERGKRLRRFYLEGLPQHHVGPIVDLAHYTFGSGQIRTNQFLNARTASPPSPVDWTLREFKTVAESDGKVAIVPDSVKTNPGNDLFLASSVDPRVAPLTQEIRAQLPQLAGLGLAPSASPVDRINAIGFNVSGEGINAFESDEKDPEIGDVAVAYSGASGTTENPVLKAAIQDALTKENLTLTPAQVVNRIKTQTCSGCHRFSDPGVSPLTDLGGGAVWPAKSNGDATHPKMAFTQESERDDDLQPAIVGSGKRYAISLAVEEFLVAREAFMKKALGLH